MNILISAISATQIQLKLGQPRYVGIEVTQTHEPPKTLRVPSQPGFALVVTISLMMMLTVIVVGLMTLSSISLRSSSRGNAVAIAQANARIALALAIGELQTYAGPDQRITGTANLAGTNTGDELAAGAAPLNNTSDSTNQPVSYPDLAARRSGWEVVEGMEACPIPGGGNVDHLGRLVTLRQARMLGPSLDPKPDTSGSIFHAATTDGFGVLADNLQGGLRSVLTAPFANGLPSSSPSSFPNAPAT